jgi:dCMP deaminase
MMKRPNSNECFMGIAIAVRKRADCTGNCVGVVIVLDRRILPTGYNGAA